jgi:hypothetical protein
MAYPRGREPGSAVRNLRAGFAAYHLSHETLTEPLRAIISVPGS